jgi:hypothetical protein
VAVSFTMAPGPKDDVPALRRTDDGLVTREDEARRPGDPLARRVPVLDAQHDAASADAAVREVDGQPDRAAGEPPARYAAPTP